MRKKLFFQIATLSIFFIGCKSIDKNGKSKTLCLGPLNSSVGFVYLHGMDSESPSTQDLLNREKLQRISQKLGFRFAVPRANTKCPSDNKMLCWGWSFNITELISIKAQVEEAAHNCNLPEKFNLIGFSNGGYAANLLYRECVIFEQNKIVSIGAALLNDASTFNKKELSRCGNIKILIGKSDKFNYDPKKALYTAIQSKNGNAQWIEFDGEHEIPEEALLQTLKE